MALRMKTGEGTSPLRLPTVKPVRSGFRGTPAELSLFIREGNRSKVLHECAKVNRNLGEGTSPLRGGMNDGQD